MDTLQSLYKFPLKTAEECFDYLGWTYKTVGDKYEDIICLCNKPVSCWGFVGTDFLECPDCKKTMQDGLGFVPCSNTSMAFISKENYSLDEQNRHWLANKPEDDGLDEIIEKFGNNPGYPITCDELRKALDKVKEE